MDEREQVLPYQKVEKIMKKALISSHLNRGYKACKDGKVDKKSVELMQELVTEFICFVTADMAEKVAKEKRVALKG